MSYDKRYLKSEISGAVPGESVSCGPEEIHSFNTNFGMSPGFGCAISQTYGGDWYSDRSDPPFLRPSEINSIYTNSSFTYSSPDKEFIRNVEESKMSLVGVNVFSDGVIAFGDSKSTKTDALDNKYEDVERNAKKLIRGRDYVIAMHGANQFYEDQILKNIEDWIQPKAADLSYPELLFEFLGNLKKNFANNANRYSFIIGAKDTHGYFFQQSEISRGDLRFSEKIYSDSCWGGVSFYFLKPQLKETVTEGYAQLKEIIKKRYLEAESLNSYNPVGYPFRFLILTENGIAERVVWD